MAKVGILSASKITSYEFCPLHFYFRYVSHEKVAEPSYFTFGKSIHYMLKLFYDKNFKSADSFVKFWKYYWYVIKLGIQFEGNNGRKRNFDELDEQVRRLKEEKKFNFKNFWEVSYYARLGVNILKKFYNKNLPKPKLYEKKFIVEFGGHKIQGIWDRIDDTKEGPSLLDYKTDKSAPKSKEDLFLLHRHPQFTIYDLAYRIVFGEPPKKIIFHHLRTGRAVKTKRSKKDHEYLNALLDKVAHGIESDEFTPFYSPLKCKKCIYIEPCAHLSIGVGSKLKELERAMAVEPEIDPFFFMVRRKITIKLHRLILKLL